MAQEKEMKPWIRNNLPAWWSAAGPVTGRPRRICAEEIEGYDYGVSLYGTPIHMGSFGLIEYRDGRLYDVMYQEGGVDARFYLNEDWIIFRIELFGGLLW